MDAEIMLGVDDPDPVLPCSEPAEVPVGDFVLCAGCYEAFEALLVLGGAALRKRGTDMLKAAFPPESEGS